MKMGLHEHINNVRSMDLDNESLEDLAGMSQCRNVTAGDMLSRHEQDKRRIHALAAVQMQVISVQKSQ